MKQKHTPEFVFLLVVIAVSLIGFSSLWFASDAERTPYHYLHIGTSLAWLLLMLSQLVLIRQNDFRRHRAVGQPIYFAGPLLVFLAFALRRNRDLHASFLLGTALMFLAIAAFFTFVSYVPGFIVTGPDTFSNFGKADQTISILILLVGLAFFLRRWRTGWPWLIAASFVTLNGLLQFYLDSAGRTSCSPISSRQSAACRRSARRS